MNPDPPAHTLRVFLYGISLAIENYLHDRGKEKSLCKS